MSQQIIQVGPLGWKDGSYEPEKVFLSEMDHTMPRIYALIAEVFELSDDLDKDTVIHNLCDGLEYALAQYPPLAGGLHMDEKDGRLCKYSILKPWQDLRWLICRNTKG